jgi:predicted dithiol-disulfide oxidoreductase (DUF899 family)
MHHPVVSQEEWLVARKALLSKEKECTRLRDQLSAERREVDKECMFDGPGGKETLADLFEGRSQLLVRCLVFCRTPAVAGQRY